MRIEDTSRNLIRIDSAVEFFTEKRKEKTALKLFRSATLFSLIFLILLLPLILSGVAQSGDYHTDHLNDPTDAFPNNYAPMVIPFNGKGVTIAPVITCTNLVENDVWEANHHPCKSAQTLFVDDDWGDRDASYTYLFEDWTDYDWNDINVSLYAVTNDVITVEIRLEDREADWKNPFSVEITPEGLTVDVHWNSTDYPGDNIVRVNSDETVDIELFDESIPGDTAFITIIPIILPVASFVYSPLYPQVYEDVTFNASASTSDGGEIVSYKWDFGDGGKGDGKIVTHTYATFGNFTVTLNVTDSEGKWDTESKNITVREHPQADFTWSPLSPQVNEDVTFDASLSTPNGGTIVGYEWDFGDGYTDSGKIVVHQFSNWGTFTVTLNVTDSEDKWDVVSKNITVRAHPHADFTWSPPYPEARHDVTFDASASTPNGGYIVSYEWNFGDGSPHKFGKIVIHKYDKAGTYIVTLTVIDSEDKSDTVQKYVEVKCVCVGGYALPIDIDIGTPNLLAPQVGLAFVLLAAMAVTTILIRRRNKTLKWEH